MLCSCLFCKERPKVKKQKVSKPPEEGSKRLKTKSLEFGMENVKINTAGELADFSIRLAPMRKIVVFAV